MPLCRQGQTSAMARLGRQTPTFITAVEYALTFGDDVVAMFESSGHTFYESQKFEMRLFMARKADGSFASRTICISKPRQNGKSYAARKYVVEMAGEGKRCLFSAHHGATTMDMFNEILEDFRSDEELHALLGENEQGVYKSAGRERLKLTNGGEIRFQTRTTSGGRGGTFDIIVIDEAQELSESQLAAVKPTTIASESGDPQMIYLGTPPDDSCTGTVFAGLHDKAHKMPDSCGFWWMEWAASELPNLADVDAVLEMAYETNPAMGYRIHEDVMLDAIRTATNEATFAREHLGYWSSKKANAVIDPGEWRKCASDERPREGLFSYAVKFSADGAVGTVSTAVKGSDGHVTIGVAACFDMSGGLSQFVELLAPLKHKAAVVVVDGMANAQPLIDELLRNGFSKKAICKPRGWEVSAACSALLNAIHEQKVSHLNQADLNDSALKSKKRPVGSSGGWSFADNDCDSTRIESCALAYWGALNTKRNPNRKQRIG